VRTFLADDDTIQAGTPATLSWTVDSGITSVAIDQGIGDVTTLTVNRAGSILISPGPMVTTTYTLTIDGVTGPASAALTLTVGIPPTMLDFAASIDPANPGLRRILTWDATGADTIAISPDVGRVPVSSASFFTILPEKSDWRFLDDGSDQGTEWTSSDLDDSSWSVGPGKFGYGESDIATFVSFGGLPNQKHITTYFRKTFSRVSVDALQQLRVGLKYDDGAVVYLNGTEVARFHMPQGSVDHLTLASGNASNDGKVFEFMPISTANLQEGKNVFAVEIHQATTGSSDMGYDFMLEGLMNDSVSVIPPGNTTYTLTATNDFGSSSTEIDVIVSSEPVAVYDFESMPPADITGVTTSTLEGAASPTTTPGRMGLGAVFLNGDTAVQISGNGSLGSLGSEFSFSFWIKASATVLADTVVLDAGIELTKADASGLCVEISETEEWIIDSIFDDNWHHILLSVDEGEIQIFRDGISVVLETLAGTIDLPDVWHLGGSDSSDHFLTGALDDFAVFDRALIPAEISRLIQDSAVSFLLPRIFGFEADDETVVEGDNVTLSWFTADADNVTISPNPGSVDNIGQTTVQTQQTTTYVLTATNAFGNTNSEVTVTTGNLPQIREFRFSPSVVRLIGETTTLSWDVLDSTTVSIDRDIGAVSGAGEMLLTPTSQAIFTLTAINDFGTSTTTATVTVTHEPIDGAWTIVIIPDTQHYTDNPTNAPIFTEITNWIVSQKDERNIRFVLHEGDIVENNSTVEWDRARASLSVLDGQVPYAMSSGNHDLGPGGNASTRDGEFNLQTRFGAGSPYSLQPTLNGFYADPGNPAYRESSYHTFHENGQDYLVLALEWSPRDAVVDWAKTVVEAHPNHRAVLLTHMYVENSGARWTGGVGFGDNNGENLWQKLVRPYENFIITANGHANSFGYSTAIGNKGNTVHQMLFNAQFEANGGDGWIRLLEFSPDGKTVDVKTHSPHLDSLGQSAWRTDPGNQFSLQLSVFPNFDGDTDGIPDGWELAHGLDHMDASDGASNLMDYAVGGSSTPLQINFDALENTKTIRLRRRIPGSSRLPVIVEKSENLTVWQPVTGLTQISVNNNGDNTEDVTLEDNSGPSPTSYYRVRVSAP
jgi:hypothetical protein